MNTDFCLGLRVASGDDPAVCGITSGARGRDVVTDARHQLSPKSVVVASLLHICARPIFLHGAPVLA